jgi:Ni/Fe-hydrogenase subunit HybB-like protein
MSEELTVERKTYLTPFNIVTGIIVILGLIVTILRFTGGLATVTNLSDYNPWGIWIGFDLLVGVALAAGGYVTSASCYIFGIKKYHSAVRPAILTGFLGYALVVLALHYDVGRPWRLPYPFLIQRGTTSLLFEVAACVALYLTVLFLESTPIALEWLGWKKARKLAVKLTLVLTIFGVILSTLHQSSLGALYLIAPSKLHPLWYSTYIPVYFFISSIIAGLSMVIFEGTLAHRFLHDKMDETHLAERDGVVLGFAKAASWVLAGYLITKVIGLSVDNNWHWLSTGYGVWFQVELIGFIALPCFLFAVGVRDRNYTIIKWTAGITIFGVILNRFNVSMIAFNWHLPSSERYFPHWMEIVISLFIVTLGVLAYRFICTRMPVLFEHPDYKDAH